MPGTTPVSTVTVDRLRTFAQDVSHNAALLTDKLDKYAHAFVPELDALNRSVAAFNDHLNQAASTGSATTPSAPLTSRPDTNGAEIPLKPVDAPEEKPTDEAPKGDQPSGDTPKPE